MRSLLFLISIIIVWFNQIAKSKEAIKQVSLLEEKIKDLQKKATETEEKMRDSLNKKLAANDQSSTIKDLETKVIDLHRKIRNMKGEIATKDFRIADYRSAAIKLVS